jgi:4-hydroxyphenylpyruvate dioxygenase-like putative hemolysin
MSDIDVDAIAAERARLQTEYIVPDRPASTGRGIHHIALVSSDVERTIRDKWEYLRGKLAAAGVAYQEESGASIYLRDPDGARLELIADPLGEMYGAKVL